jgi:hypothetical protein
VKFSSTEQFELHVHKCFGRIFELLLQIDAVVKQEAEKEEAAGTPGMMNDLRDWVEETILHCHLAWQYHRLSQGPRTQDSWDKVEASANGKTPSD